MNTISQFINEDPVSNHAIFVSLNNHSGAEFLAKAEPNVRNNIICLGADDEAAIGTGEQIFAPHVALHTLKALKEHVRLTKAADCRVLFVFDNVLVH